MRTILVVDDNADNRYIATQMLSLSGYQAVGAVNGAEALALLEQTVPDLILMDLTMPQLDGWATTERIKASPHLAHIPVVAVTSHVIGAELERALEAGCVDYLTKPFEYLALLEKVKAHLA